jgi:hypothetical protein
MIMQNHKNINTMRKAIHFWAVTIILILAFMVIMPVIGQTNGNPPPPPSMHGSDQNQLPGGGAPLGSGIELFVLLGAAYGFKKFNNYKSMNRD